MRVTDTHVHIYSNDEIRYPMVAEPLRPPPGTGTVAHLRREMADNGVQRVVAIHTSTAYCWDNRFLADSATANLPWMVGCCTLNPLDPASPDRLRDLVRHNNVRAMRSLPAEGSAGPVLNDPRVETLWRVADDESIVINVLIHLDLADELEQMLRRHGRLIRRKPRASVRVASALAQEAFAPRASEPGRAVRAAHRVRSD